MSDLTSDIEDALFAMFSSEGWHYFLEDAKANLETANTLDDITGDQALGVRQGQVAVLRSIISYEDTIRHVIAEQRDADDVADDDENNVVEL